MVANSPISPRHTHLLAAYLALRFDLPALAAQENLSATELLEFFEAIQPHLQNLRQALEESLHLQSLSAKSAAFHTLESLTRSSENPLEQRRAAAHILRGLGVRQSEPSGASRRTIPFNEGLGTKHSAPPSTPSPRPRGLQELLSLLHHQSPPNDSPLPSSSLHPHTSSSAHPTSSQQTAQQILTAACNPQSPDSATTIHNHLAPNATINDKPISQPQDIPPLLEELSSAKPVREITLSAPATDPDRPDLHGYSAELTHEDDAISHLALVLTNAGADDWRLNALYQDTS